MSPERSFRKTKYHSTVQSLLLCNEKVIRILIDLALPINVVLHALLYSLLSELIRICEAWVFSFVNLEESTEPNFKKVSGRFSGNPELLAY